MSPFLLAIGLPAPTAVGTDLVYATVTKLFGSVQHYRQRSVNLQLVGFLALGSVPAGLLGVATVNWLKGSLNPDSVGTVLTAAIGAVVILAGVSLAVRDFIPQRPEKQGRGGWDGKSPMSFRRRALTISLGAVGGYLVGLTSIGSGTMIAIVLLMLYPLSPAVIVGTDVAHALVLSFVVGLVHAISGNVDFSVAGTLLLGGAPGALIGSRLTKLVPGRPLRLLLAVMLICVGVKTFLGA